MTDLLPDAHPTAAPLHLLSDAVVGRVVTPADDGYPAAAMPWNVAVPSTPVVVVEVESAADVATTVRFAAEHGLRVDVRATGHGALPMDRPTLLVHTRRLDEVTVHPEGRWARVGAGVQWATVLAAAAEHGLTGLCGSTPGTSVVGYLTGGGLGVLSRTHGYASDHVRAFDVVTGDGEVRRATADENPELFWGLRGGKSALGIVTAVEFDLLPQPELLAGALYFAAGDIARVLHAWRAWAPTLPVQASTSVAVLRLPPLPDVPPPLAGQCTLALRFAWTGDPAEGEALLAPMRSVGTPVLGGVGMMPSAAIGAVHADPVDPMPAVDRMQMLQELSAETVDALLALVGPEAPCPQIVVELRLLGGALDAADDHRGVLDRPYAAFTLSTIGIAAPPVVDVTLGHAAAVMAATSPWSDGRTLPNFGATGDPARVATLFSPTDAARLGRLAAAYDPQGVLTGADVIRAATGAGTVDSALELSEIADVWD